MRELKKNPEELRSHDTHPELPLDPDVARPGIYKWPPHFTATFLSVVFIGGCLGAAARYWAGLQLPAAADGWPVSTLSVNLLGAFLLGLLLEGLARLGEDEGIRRIIRLGVGTGFVGAFTTYSALAVETDALIRHGHIALAGWYMVASLAGGIIFSAAGIWAAASHHKRRGAG